jgi:hypothetical protein
MGFLDYDVEISKIICSTNAIESLNATTDAPRAFQDRSVRFTEGSDQGTGKTGNGMILWPVGQGGEPAV